MGGGEIIGEADVLLITIARVDLNAMRTKIRTLRKTLTVQLQMPNTLIYKQMIPILVNSQR